MRWNSTIEDMLWLFSAAFLVFVLVFGFANLAEAKEAQTPTTCHLGSR